MSLRSMAAAVMLFVPVAASHAAAATPPACVISARDPIVFFDQLGAAFERLDSALAAELASGTAKLTPAKRDEMSGFAKVARNAFSQIEKKRSARNVEAILWQSLGDYKDYVDLAYNSALPPAPIQTLICPLLDSYISVTQAQLVDHERRFQVRYGENSERLNIVEILLTEILQEKRAMGPLRSPGRWEPIVRLQALGMHYDLAAEQLRATSPIYQAGTSLYLYGDNRIARAINHIGVAFAYQKDLASKQELRGAVLHVRTFDIGLLCPDSGCDDGIVVASKNMAPLSEAWTWIRKKIH